MSTNNQPTKLKISKPTKKQVLVSILSLFVALLSLYGLVSGYNAFVVYKEKKLDAYALNRVNSQGVLKAQFITDNRDSIYVPVIMKAEVEAQINQAINTALGK